MHSISNTVERKFVDSIEVSDWEIESETGWVDVTHINKTVEYEVFVIETESGKRIECADNHILFDKNGEIFAKDLKPSHIILGQSGPEVVSATYKTDKKEHMYDLSASGNHTYYAEGLLHHNTTTTAAFICWYMLFNDERTVAILANKAATAREILQRVETAYEYLPKWMQSGVVEWNKGSVALENGSRVIASATSSSAIRGYSLSCVTGDTKVTIRDIETGEVKEVSMCELEIILENKRWEILTENGFKPFSGLKKSSQRTVQKTMVLGVEVKCTPDHKFLVDGQWIEAKDLPHEALEDKEDVYDALNVADGNHYLTNGVTSHNCVYLDEFAHVENHVADEFFTSVFPTISSGKETKILMSSTPNGYNMFYKFWSDAEKNLNGFVHQRFDWWEHPERDQKWADEQKVVLGDLKYTQEVGMEFLGSSKTLLTGETLRSLAYRTPGFEHGKGEYRGLKIYDMPEVDRNYVMTVDVSRGRHLDASAFGIFDVTEYPHRIVATYNNADVSPLMYSGICYNMAKKYNDAYILVEINDIGGQVAEEIYYTYEYGEMFWTKTGDVLGKQGADDYPGIRTTKKTKRIGCANLKDIIEKNQLIVDDWQMIQELATFVQNDAGTWEADEGFRDDSVAVLWLFSWLVMQPWFSDLTDKDIRSRMYRDKVKEMEDELLPPTILTGEDWITDESPEALGLRELL